MRRLPVTPTSFPLAKGHQFHLSPLRKNTKVNRNLLRLYPRADHGIVTGEESEIDARLATGRVKLNLVNSGPVKGIDKVARAISTLANGFQPHRTSTQRLD